MMKVTLPVGRIASMRDKVYEDAYKEGYIRGYLEALNNIEDETQRRKDAALELSNGDRDLCKLL